MAVHVRDIPVVSHREWVALTAQVNDALVKGLRQLEASDWQRPTDCERWSVKDIAAHLLGWAECFSSRREFLRQNRRAWVRRKELGNFLNAQNETQVEDRRSLTSDELVARLEDRLPKYAAFRRRVGALGRGIPAVFPWQGIGFTNLRYLTDTISARDVFMHRIDIARATGRELEHCDADGRIVADLVRDWARRNKADARVSLAGRVGADFVAGDGSRAEIAGDAIEFCRILAGRGGPELMDVAGDVSVAETWLERGAPF